MTDEVKWEDPPETGTGPTASTWATRLAPLRERPGVWANFGEQQASVSTRIRRGHVSGTKPGEFEATTRGQGKDGRSRGRAILYVRFVGKPNLKAAAS